ncbi:1315_t:CDS:1 [Funneliformis geosporum]|uniref:1315_t:CDS:1 n=1 Tax=Funneliformis geosporum TaxID=1117311 RepID=A0A9W4SAB7_9GLOM|nr:1315_t:CDS:1 [Funneliformis geosporum]
MENLNKKIIEIKQTTKIYHSKRVLNKVTFSVRQGTIHGFIGPNGAGKSTTLNISTRLVLPNGGEQYIDFKSVRNNPNFNQRLGYVTAEPKFPNLTVETHVLDCGYLRGISEEKVLQKLTNSPLNQFRYQNCLSLSTGWKKILQFFILSLYQPKIYLMDEPFNGLDPSFRHELFNELERIAKKGGTILISTHILSDLQKFADNEELEFDMTMIKNGEIVYTGTKTADIEKTYEKYFIEKKRGLFEL